MCVSEYYDIDLHDRELEVLNALPVSMVSRAMAMCVRSAVVITCRIAQLHSGVTNEKTRPAPPPALPEPRADRPLSPGLEQPPQSSSHPFGDVEPSAQALFPEASANAPADWYVIGSVRVWCCVRHI